jgi:hypothetical protein
MDYALILNLKCLNFLVSTTKNIVAPTILALDNHCNGLKAWFLAEKPARLQWFNGKRGGKYDFLPTYASWFCCGESGYHD